MSTNSYNNSTGLFKWDKSGDGFLLSTDELELVKNIALSLESEEEIVFLNKVAEKEYVTAEDKEKMMTIFAKATGKIREEASLSL
ncbi:MAG: hypothetical protein PQJ58_18240 [Spirochaetales bacterium]|nr:hypothetical protein [Spirochaetales bacterium]